jgi:hypothetical protein
VQAELFVPDIANQCPHAVPMGFVEVLHLDGQFAAETAGWPAID